MLSYAVFREVFFLFFLVQSTLLQNGNNVKTMNYNANHFVILLISSVQDIHSMQLQ